MNKPRCYQSYGCTVIVTMTYERRRGGRTVVAEVILGQLIIPEQQLIAAGGSARGQHVARAAATVKVEQTRQLGELLPRCCRGEETTVSTRRRHGRGAGTIVPSAPTKTERRVLLRRTKRKTCH